MCLCVREAKIDQLNAWIDHQETEVLTFGPDFRRDSWDKHSLASFTDRSFDRRITDRLGRDKSVFQPSQAWTY